MTSFPSNLTVQSPTEAFIDGQQARDVTSVHRIQLLLHELELQTQQTQFIYSQMQLLKQQLAAEKAAKVEAQVNFK